VSPCPGRTISFHIAVRRSPAAKRLTHRPRTVTLSVKATTDVPRRQAKCYAMPARFSTCWCCGACDGGACGPPPSTMAWCWLLLVAGVPPTAQTGHSTRVHVYLGRHNKNTRVSGPPSPPRSRPPLSCTCCIAAAAHLTRGCRRRAHATKHHHMHLLPTRRNATPPPTPPFVMSCAHILSPAPPPCASPLRSPHNALPSHTLPVQARRPPHMHTPTHPHTHTHTHR
jgi:hypothetical protein